MQLTVVLQESELGLRFIVSGPGESSTAGRGGGSSGVGAVPVAGTAGPLCGLGVPSGCGGAVCPAACVAEAELTPPWLWGARGAAGPVPADLRSPGLVRAPWGFV